MLHEDEFDPALGDEFVVGPPTINTTGKNDDNGPCLAFGGATFRVLKWIQDLARPPENRRRALKRVWYLYPISEQRINST